MIDFAIEGILPPFKLYIGGSAAAVYSDPRAVRQKYSLKFFRIAPIENQIMNFTWLYPVSIDQPPANADSTAEFIKTRDANV